MPNLSQIFTNGAALQADAGPVAIAQNDLVVLGGVLAQLYPVQVSDYAAVAAAGSSAVALTTVSANGAQFETRNRAVVDPADGSVYVADTYLNVATGCQVWKYSVSGGLLRNLILDSGAINNYVQIHRLANGNLLVFWNNISTPYTQYFAILDTNLNIIVAKTAIANANVNPQPCGHMTPLSGGGFAFAYAVASVGIYFTIRANNGAVVYGPTLIAGAPNPNSGASSGPRFKLAQLSDGNIFIGINDSQQADGIRYCIFTPAGVVVKAYTTIAGSGSSASYPELSILPGYVCIAANKAYVLNNAGTLQGGSTSTAGAQVRVINDGTYFWLFHYSSGLVMSRIPTSGAGIVVNTLAGPTGLNGDVFIERGVFVAFDGANAYVISGDAAGAPSLLTSCAFPAVQTIGAVGDFCAIGLQVGKFQITKYMNASIFGIAQTAVAADNAGTPITVNEGPGGYITSPIKGSVGKAFDHSSATIVGNKGAMFPTSTALKGI